MNHRYIVFIVLSILLNQSYLLAQRNDDDKYAKRYRLELPEEWTKKPRLMRAITNILPQTLSKISDFDFCTYGKAKYVVKLYVGRLNVMNEYMTPPIEGGGKISYIHSFEYTFYAGLLLCDTNGRGISMLRLNDPDDVYNYRKEYVTFANQRPGLPALNPVLDMEASDNVNSSNLPDVLRRRSLNNRNSPKRVKDILTTDFFLRICMSKIYETQRLLRDIASVQ